ncbi:MAG: ATP synthase F1 subunit delta [Elusimicrobiaceae bacterium]|nr:ATP synthase F1 subunit delta [Elusimicrobiaceae bacterium]
MNSQQRIAAARYAAAYDSLSTSLSQAQQNVAQLDGAVRILAGVEAYMQSPRIISAHKKLVLQETLKQFPTACAFICVLISAKRYNLLAEICKQVHTLLDDRRGISRAVVTSARVLSQAQQAAAQKALSARYGKTVEAVFKTDPSLLGGLQLACNGELIDGSVKTRLAKLQQELKG